MKTTPILVVGLMACAAALDFQPACAAEAGVFRESTRYDLGGEGGWDYLTVDAEARRIFIARANRVMVLDADSGKLLGEVAGLEGAHGIALQKGIGRGFASSGKSGEVVAFDLSSLKVLRRIKAGKNPDAILYDPFSERVFAFSGKSKDASAIDPRTFTTLATIPLGGKPEFAVSDGRGKVYVNLEDSSELLAIDSLQLKALSRYSLKPCEEPTGLSMDLQSRKLIVGCGNRLAAIVDADAGRVTQTFQVGSGVDATAFDPSRRLAFISAGEGILSVLSEDEKGFHSLQDIPTAKGARTLAEDPKTGRVFLPVARFEPEDPAKPSSGHSRPVVPGTFALIVVERK